MRASPTGPAAVASQRLSPRLAIPSARVKAFGRWRTPAGSPAAPNAAPVELGVSALLAAAAAAVLASRAVTSRTVALRADAPRELDVRAVLARRDWLASCASCGISWAIERGLGAAGSAAASGGSTLGSEGAI